MITLSIKWPAPFLYPFSGFLISREERERGNAVPVSQPLCNRCSIPWALWPFDELAAECPCLFCMGESRTGHNAPAGSHQCWGVGFPLLTCCWCSYQRLALLWGPITGSWSPWHLPGHPGSFLPSCFSACSAPTWYTGILLPMSRLGIFLLLKFMRFLFAHFCRLSRFPLNDGATIWSINYSFQFRVICKYADAMHRFRGVPRCNKTHNISCNSRKPGGSSLSWPKPG